MTKGTSVEMIEAAIIQLKELKANSTQGPWSSTDELWDGSGRWDIEAPGPERVTADGDGIGSIHNRADVDLITCLHATIDAQLAILRHALEESNNYIYRDGWRLVDNDAAVLAEAILWGNE